MVSWTEIRKNMPATIKFKDIENCSNRFGRYCYIKNKRFDFIKESLLNARGELEKMITLILNYMKKDDVNLDNKVSEIIYEEFAINFAGFMKIIDTEQNTQFVKVDDKDISLPRLVSFKIFLETAFFDIIFIPLKNASEKYVKNKKDDEFFYNWFIGVTSVLKVKAGLRRENIKSNIFRGTGQFVPYSYILSKSMEEKIGGKEGDKKTPLDKEWEDTFGSEEEEEENV